MNSAEQDNYFYKDASANPSHKYLWPVVEQAIARHQFGSEMTAIDVGCGNGAISELLRQRGFKVVGIDPSERGIRIAEQTFPNVDFFLGDAYDDLAQRHGTFSLVVSLEVIEHLYNPQLFAKTLYNLLSSAGVGVISTPYHGYWKNLAISVMGGWEKHHNPLWFGGHIKFFGADDLRRLLSAEGFKDISIVRVGRAIPALAMSMVAIVRK